MDRAKKLFKNKVRPIFGKNPSRAERTGRGDNSATSTPSHPDEERVISSTENTTSGDILGAPELEHKNIDKQYPNDQRDTNSTEKVREVQGIDPSTSNSQKHHGAVGHDKEGELLVPSSLSPMAHSPSESMRFEDTKNSGISVGGGSVSVSNTTITGTLIQNNTTSERIRPGLKLLQKRVATSAFHNSAQRVDPPRCHENTRVAILKQIYDWILLDLLTRQAWIMWIHGAAGGGKSAIMQSIAELCEQAQIPLASFFFFRTDPMRNSMAFFIGTLVYQLIQLIPQVKDEILSIIESNPLIFDQSLKSQLEKLIIQPLLRVRDHFKHFFVIMIDGLDECTERAHQVDLIKLLGTVSHSRSIPIIFLVASRREPQIEAAFVRKQISELVLTLPLDNSDIEQTSEDIRHFLNDRFLDITETHLHRHLLPANWPPASMVEEIVTKSSGQFIYASVVINYVSSPRGHPAHLLEIVRGIRSREPSSQNPFAHLDALYQHIFSQVEVLDKVLDILAYNFITQDEVFFTEEVFLLGAGGLAVYLADLTAVINCASSNEPIKYLHASLPDFLRDKTRSERYHIDAEEYLPKLLYMFLDRVPQQFDPALQAIDSNTVAEQEEYRIWALRNLLRKGAKASDQLQQSFMTFTISFNEKTFSRDFLVWHIIDILEELEKLNFNDEGQAYNHVLNMFAAGLAKHWSSLDSDDKDEARRSPDLLACISQIRQEELSFDSPESDPE